MQIVDLTPDLLWWDYKLIIFIFLTSSQSYTNDKLSLANTDLNPIPHYKSCGGGWRKDSNELSNFPPKK